MTYPNPHHAPLGEMPKGYWVHNPACGRTVGECVRRSWKVVVACRNGHGRTWNVDDLEQDFAADVTLEAIAERLKCSVCGATEGSLDIMQDNGATQRRNIEQFNAKDLGAGAGPEAG